MTPAIDPRVKPIGAALDVPAIVARARAGDGHALADLRAIGIGARLGLRKFVRFRRDIVRYIGEHPLRTEGSKVSQ